jgi:hypothetical protein
VLAAALLVVPFACPPTTVGGRPPPDQVGHAFAAPYGFYLEERARAPRSEPVAPDLPLWDLELALRELAPSEPEARWVAWVLARAADKPATAYGHLVAALADDSLSASRLLWWREQVVNDIDARDALFDAWDSATAPSTRALLAVAIALALWDASCPVDPAPDGACRVSTDFEARGQIMRRDPIVIEEAQRWTVRARELRRGLAHSDLAVAALEQQLALAAAVVDYEVLLTVHLPEDLDFMIEEWRRGSGVRAWERIYTRQLRTATDSKRRVGRFFDSTVKCMANVSELDDEAVENGDADVAVTAVLREATLAVALEDAIYGGGPSPEVRRWNREARERGEHPRYDASDSQFYYLGFARMLLDQCVEYGTAWGAAGEAVDACFAWRSALDPDRQPELIPDLIMAAHSSFQRHGPIAPAELDEFMDQ